MSRTTFYTLFFKRFLDVVLSIVTLVALFPMMLIVAILIRIKLGSPIFFIQSRPGKNEKIFKIYKFRTMLDRCDKNSRLLSDSLRLTKLGKFIRSTSLDELPSLVNIIKGEMSIVGPRPLLEEYLPLYNQKQRTRHLVKSGLTGWSQVNGRNSIAWQQKFADDLYYVENFSFVLDMKIMFKTFLKVIKRSDINANERLTMPKFTGK